MSEKVFSFLFGQFFCFSPLLKVHKILTAQCIDIFCKAEYNVEYRTFYFQKSGEFMKKTVHKELRSLSHLIFRTIENRSNKKKIESMSGNNGCIIGYLSDNRERDVFQRDLEKEFGITRSTASKVVNLMEQKGLVEKRSVSYDARLKKLVLTEKSEAIAHLMSDDMTKLESVLTDGFSDGELDTLYSYIDRMKNNLKNYKPNKKEEN